MLQVGADSYVSVEEADLYISEFYMQKESENIMWSALSIIEKEQLLHRAMMYIEEGKCPGRKSKVSQALQFPRYPDLDIEPQVKNAQVECAISLNSLSSNAGADLALKNRIDLLNIKSIKMGDTQEQYGTSKENTSCGYTELYKISPKSVTWLRPWLEGGYPICI